MKKILIIGLGLIGGSFARAIRQHNIADKIFAFDNNIETVSTAKNIGIIDEFQPLDNNLGSFDLIVIASPLSSYQEILAKISAAECQNTVVIDLGSLKEHVIKLLPTNLQKNFIACHPIAGSDKTGFESSSAELFFDKKFVICKTKNNDEKFLKIVENVVGKIGAKIDFLDAKAHDEIYGLVSHLPQFLSFLSKEFAPEQQDDAILQTAFRLDNSSPEIWNDIFKINQKNIEKFYLEFFKNFEDLVTKISNQKYDDIALELNKISTLQCNSQNLEQKEFDFKEEKSSILFRLIIVASYLKIKQMQNLQSFGGSGFKDFTSIISYVKLPNNIASSLKESRKEILSFAKEIGF